MILKSRKQRLAAIAALSAGVLVMTACGSSLGGSSDSGDSKNGDVKVGLIVAQTGGYADVGKDMENGFKLYLDQHNNELGGHKIDLTTVDEGDNPQTGVTAATRLVSQDKVDVVVGVVSGATATGSADIFTNGKVPVMFGNSGALSLGTDKASPYIFRANYANDQPLAVLGSHLKEELPADEKVILIGPDYAGGHELLQGFKDVFPKDKILDELYPPFNKTKDYSPYLSKIKQSGARNVVAFFAGREAIDFTQQFAKFGLSSSLQLYAAGDLTEGNALTAEVETAKGIKTVLNYNYDIDTPLNKKFAPAFEVKFGNQPTVRAAVMYDVAIMLDHAIDQIDGKVTRQAIADQLAKITDVNGVRGNLHFNEQRTVVQDWYLREVKEVAGQLTNVVLEKLPSEFLSSMPKG